MKRKIYFILLTYVSLSFCSLIFHACRKTSRLCTIQFDSIPDTGEPDSLISKIHFVVYAYSAPNCCIPGNFSLITPCYAFTVCQNWQNYLLQKSFNLSFDKSIVVAGDTVSSGDNLFKNLTIASEMEIVRDEYDCKGVRYDITFSDELRNQMTFEEGIYNATFTCMTNDSILLMKKRMMVFR